MVLSYSLGSRRLRMRKRPNRRLPICVIAVLCLKPPKIAWRDWKAVLEHCCFHPAWQWLTRYFALFALVATSLGGVESLVEQRGSVEGPKSPCPNDLLRLSVGIEDVEDLYEDLVRALKA